MKLSTKGRYSVRAMVAMAILADGNKPVSLKQISAHEGISVSYLEQLFVHLRRAGLVRSVRGPGGGYLFAKDLDQITVAGVMDVVQECMQPVNCAACTQDVPACDAGRGSSKCLTRPLWDKLDDTIGEFLESITLQNITDGRV